MARKKIDVEIMKLDPDHIMKCLDWLYDRAVEDGPILKSAKDIGNHYAAGTGSLEERARRLVRWQVTKAGTSGFLLGLGGVITMPVAIPANIASVMYVQIRMIAAVAHLGGHDIQNDQVRTLCYACMCGKAAADVVKNTGIRLGTKLTVEAIKKVAGKTLTDINKKVGFRLVTKALTLHLARSEGHERYLGCNLMHHKVLASSQQHLMAEAPVRASSGWASNGTATAPLRKPRWTFSPASLDSPVTSGSRVATNGTDVPPGYRYQRSIVLPEASLRDQSGVLTP